MINMHKNKCLYLHKSMYSVAIFSFNNKPFLQVFNTCEKRVRQMETHIVFIYTLNSLYHCWFIKKDILLPKYIRK